MPSAVAEGAREPMAIYFFQIARPANKDAAFAGNLRRVRYARKSRDNSLTLPEIASSLLYADTA